MFKAGWGRVKERGDFGMQKVTTPKSYTSYQRDSNIVRILEFAKEYFYMLRERSLFMRGGDR